MRRGDIVICALQGDSGNPRPAVVVQSDLFSATHPSVTICQVTSEFIDAPLFRISIDPSANNGLKKPSQIMIDKIQSAARAKIGKVVGKLEPGQLELVDHALALWIGPPDAVMVRRHEVQRGGGSARLTRKPASRGR